MNFSFSGSIQCCVKLCKCGRTTGNSGRKKGLNKVVPNIHDNQEMLSNVFAPSDCCRFLLSPPGEGRVSREGWQRVIWVYCVYCHPARCLVGLAGCLAVLWAIPSLNVTCRNAWGPEGGGGGTKQTPPRV